MSDFARARDFARREIAPSSRARRRARDRIGAIARARSIDRATLDATLDARFAIDARSTPRGSTGARAIDRSPSRSRGDASARPSRETTTRAASTRRARWRRSRGGSRARRGRAARWFATATATTSGDGDDDDGGARDRDDGGGGARDDGAVDARSRRAVEDARERCVDAGGDGRRAEEGGTRAREADATADGRAEDDDARARVDAGVMRVRWTIAEGQGRGEDAAVPVYSFDGEARGSVELPGRIFDQPLRVDVAHRVVRWQRAKARKGLHKTKSRGEVAGSTRKVRPQKGSGRARVGNLKAPQMRGGGTAHGPVVRSHAHALPKKVRRMGLKVALSAKAAEGKLIVVDSFAGMEPKTRAMKATLERLTGDLGLAAGGEFHSTLIIDGEFEEMAEGVVDAEDQFGPSELVRMSSRNLPHVEVLPQIGANVYSILRRRTLIVTKSGLEQLIARLDAPIKR